MALKRRDCFVAALVAFISWGYLTSWLPILKYLGYAFTIGAAASSLAILSLVVLSTTSSYDGDNNRKLAAPSPAFVTPETFKEEIQWLSDARNHSRETIYPASAVISESFDSLLKWILRDFVTSWYGNISKSPEFVNEIDRNIHMAVINIVERISSMDVIEAIISRIVPLVTAHLRDFDEAERAVRGKHLTRNVTESEFFLMLMGGKFC